jgi:rhamnose utilization protein RhaD (predicted bifunctional aldolase and dehydrogenase)
MRGLLRSCVCVRSGFFLDAIEDAQGILAEQIEPTSRRNPDNRQASVLAGQALRGSSAQAPARRQQAARRKMIRGAQNAQRIWEPEQDRQLREMAEAGKSVTMMALRLKRTEMALRQRLHTLKILLRDNKRTRPDEHS